MKTYKGYGNRWKIYSMNLFQLWLLQLGLFFIYLTRPLRAKNFLHIIQKIPYLIITPSGIHIDRRTQAHPFRASERRYINILRYKLHIWLYGPDDTEGVS